MNRFHHQSSQEQTAARSPTQAWDALVTDLDTAVPSLDEVTLARVQQRLHSAVRPRRRRRARLIAGIAAALVLSACGYAVATGQFSRWFWNLAQDPKSPETSETILSSIGTVISQSQTANGVTATLNGALWDGDTLQLSISLAGESLPKDPLRSVQSQASWLRSSDAQLRRSFSQLFPEMDEAELEEQLRQYLESLPASSRSLHISYLFNQQTQSHSLQIEHTLPNTPTQPELTLHLEDLEIGDAVIQGPFEFTFQLSETSGRLVYLGQQEAEPVSGYPIQVYKIIVSPLWAEVAFTGLTPLATENTAPEERPDFFLEALRVDGEVVEVGYAPSGARFSWGPDSSWSGSVSCGPFSWVLDPAAVEAVRINDTWIDLSQFTLQEEP